MTRPLKRIPLFAIKPYLEGQGNLVSRLMISGANWDYYMAYKSYEPTCSAPLVLQINPSPREKPAMTRTELASARQC